MGERRHGEACRTGILIQPRTLFLLWSALVIACGIWHSVCACGLRARADAMALCAGEPVVCLRWETVTAFSPRWLSDSLGISGPLVTWLLLGPTLVATARVALLCDILLWYLALIMAVRYLHLALPSGWPAWDPSGHVFVYGAQLVPVWLVSHLVPAHDPRGSCTLRGVALHSARGYALVLVYASATTAAFFHSLSESVCALALVALPLLAHERMLGAHPVWASGRAGARLCGLWLLQAGLVAYALREQPRARARLGRQAVYDAVLWSGYWLTLRYSTGSVNSPGSASPQSLLQSETAD